VDIPKLEIKNIIHFYEEKKILDINRVYINEGESVVIFGPNGSGKSTLLRIMSLIEKPSKGEIYFKGEKINKKNSLNIRRNFVLLLQKPIFFRGKVKDNIIYGLKIRKIPGKEIQLRLKKIISLLSLEKLIDRRIDELSGGEEQKINLARALILQPEILFLDEPFSFLDASVKEEVIYELRRIIKKLKQTTVFVTHDWEEAVLLGDRVILLYEGKVYQEGPIEEVFNKPKHKMLAKLVGVETILKGIIKNREGKLLKISVNNNIFQVIGDGELGEEVFLGIKPEEVFISKNRPEGSVRNWFLGEIEEIIPSGRVMEIKLNCGFPLKAFITKASCEELNLNIGKKVWAGIKATSIHVIKKGK
jgi:molybdopterin-binding protein